MSGHALSSALSWREDVRPAGDARSSTHVSCSALSALSIGQLVARGTRVRLTVRGNSMSPTIQSRDRVILGPRPDRVSRGDLVVVRSGEGLSVRRFVDRPSQGVMFTTSGKGRGRGIPVTEAALVAAIVAVERNGRVVPSEPRGHALARLVSTVRRLVRRIGR